MKKTIAEGYQPERPLFPDKGVVKLPVVELIPFLDPKAKWYKRMWTFFTKRPKYIVYEDYFCWIPKADAWMWLPKNFVYDFASIPKMMPLITPMGIFAYPASPHDCIYRFRTLLLSKGPGEPFVPVFFTRREADLIFQHLANKASSMEILSFIATGMLRVFGGMNYKTRSIMTVDWSKPVE